MPKLHKKKKYQWIGFSYKCKPDDAMDVFQELRGENGGLLLDRDIVKHARKKKSPLHGCFPWDDRVAADTYRLVIARGMKKSLRIRVVDPVTKEVALRRVFVHVEKDGVSGHLPFEAAGDYTVFIATEAEDYLRGVRGRLEELAERFGFMEKVIASVDIALRRLRKKRAS